MGVEDQLLPPPLNERRRVNVHHIAIPITPADGIEAIEETVAMSDEERRVSLLRQRVALVSTAVLLMVGGYVQGYPQML